MFACEKVNGVKCYILRVYLYAYAGSKDNKYTNKWNIQLKSFYDEKYVI